MTVKFVADDYIKEVTTLRTQKTIVILTMLQRDNQWMSIVRYREVDKSDGKCLVWEAKYETETEIKDFVIKLTREFEEGCQDRNIEYQLEHLTINGDGGKCMEIMQKYSDCFNITRLETK